MDSSEKGDDQKNNKTSPPSSPESPKTMQEVWDVITKPSRFEENLDMTKKRSGGVNLQDFLAQPFAKVPLKTTLVFTRPSPPVLNLNSLPDLNSAEPSKVTAVSKGKPYVWFGSSHTSKIWEPHPNDSIRDRRFKRMMKNRESASRSRARKQAYLIELEGEIAALKEENERLRQELERVRNGSLSEEDCKPPPKKNLPRSSSGPY